MDVALGGPATGPLAGIRVIDLSTMVSGPLCTQVLGDLGADVTKIESRTGDTARRLGPPFRADRSGFFHHFNRNKRSVSVDLKSADGVGVVRTLATRADVVIENFRPGVVERLGLGWDVLSAANPKLLYVSISGFGPDGPYRDLPAYDTVIQGLVGFMPVQGRAEGPQLVRSIIADKTTALTAAYATLAGLLARERSGGRGQRIDVPMLDAFAAFMLPDVMTREAFVPTPPPAFEMPDVHRTWRTADGHVVLMIIEDHQFQGLCRALGREDLIQDPRCANLLARILHSKELFAELQEELCKWTTADVIERGRQFGAPVAPANGVDEFLADPQVAANRTVFETESDELGRVRMLRQPARFSDTPANLRTLPRRLGEDTDAVLREAGFADAEIARLREAGAIG